MTGLLEVLVPAVFTAGVVLVYLGLAGASKPPRARRAVRSADWMAQAGLRGVRLRQLVALCGGAGFAAASVVLLLTGTWEVALAFAVLCGYAPVFVLRGRRRRQLRELQEVWPDAIDNLVSAIRAGLSLPEGVAALAERGPEPLRPFFARFADDYRASGRFGDALGRLKDDLRDPTADRVVEALRIAREVGGTELGRTLRTLSVFLRDEYRVRKEIEARQTWVVVSARLAFATPWFTLLALCAAGGAAVAYRQPAGAVVIAAGGVLTALGYRLMLAVARIPPEERVLG